MAKKRPQEKFAFGTDFQEAILQYTVTNKYGYKALEFYEETYFDLLSHSTVAHTLKKYYKRKKKIPTKVVFRESLRQLYDSREFRKILTNDLKEEINILVENIYSTTLVDGEDILEQVVKFAQYVELKSELETIDITDFSKYETINAKITRAINIGRDLKNKRGIKFIADAEERLVRRNMDIEGFESPFWQLNRSQNSHRIKKGALIMLMSKEKRFKTGCMMNISIKCMGRKKNGLFIDLENGEDELAARGDQNIINSTELELKSGDLDQKLLKQIRKYRRLGVELIIRRMPSLQTTAHDIQKIIDELKTEDGITVNYLVVDSGDLLGATSGKKDDTERISDAYLDMKNLAEANELDFVLTASHINKEGEKRIGTKFQSNDVAKCKDKFRHLDIGIGLQENDEEKEAGVMRWEIIEQRNGPQNFSMYFWVDIPRQRLREFTKAEVTEMRAQLKESYEEANKKRKEKTSDL